MKSSNHKNKNKSAGFSLIGAVAALGAVSTLMVGGAYFASQTKTVEVKFNLQAELDRAHLVSLQKNRSIKNLKDQLSIPPALANCLSRQGANCDQSTAWPKDFQRISSGTGASCAGNHCQIVSELSYRVICSSATTCESIEIQVTTNPPMSSGNNAQSSFRIRKSNITVPGNLFADRARINFSCGNQSVINGIDLKNLVAQCSTTIPNSNCNNQAPLKNYKKDALTQDALCPNIIASTSCPRGVQSAGLLGGQFQCR